MKSEAEVLFRPTIAGTLVILLACLVSFFVGFIEGDPSYVARLVSIVWIVGIGIGCALDLRLGLRNLIRVDVFALLALYFFIYFEFLFPQGQFDSLVVAEYMVPAIHLSSVGLAALVIGRHIDLSKEKILPMIGMIQIRRGDILFIYFAAFIISHLPMWIAVGFNPVQWFEELLLPRFYQSWGRGKYGDASSLLYELQLLGYVIPPIAGVILAKRKEYKAVTVFLVVLVLLILWFVAFCSGTRGILGIQLAGFIGGFLIIQTNLNFWKMGLLALVIGGSFFYLADHMLDFRQIGLRQYVEEGRYTSEYREFADEYMGQKYGDSRESGYFVDYNLWRIAQLVEVFPEQYGHLGWNLPFVAITKPIPRALWPGKPKDLKVGLEEALGAEGYTVACTWIGEAHVAGGYIWIVGIGLIIGVFCRFWNHLAQYIHSPFPLIVFASGFYAVLLLMRSLMFFTTALLPPMALILFGVFLYKSRKTD